MGAPSSVDQLKRAVARFASLLEEFDKMDDPVSLEATIRDLERSILEPLFSSLRPYMDYLAWERLPVRFETPNGFENRVIQSALLAWSAPSVKDLPPISGLEASFWYWLLITRDGQILIVRNEEAPDTWGIGNPVYHKPLKVVEPSLTIYALLAWTKVFPVEKIIWGVNGLLAETVRRRENHLAPLRKRLEQLQAISSAASALKAE